MTVHPAYVAGYIDGDGTIGIAKQKTSYGKYHYNAYISAGGTDKRALLQIRNIYGGNVTEILSLTRLLDEYRPMYRWSLGEKEHLLRCLGSIEPFLILKNQQAKLLLEFLKGRGTNSRWGRQIPEEEFRRREVIYRQIKVLNKTGRLLRSLNRQLEEGVVA